MAFLDKEGLQTVTNRLVQGDAIKVASHRGRNVKTIIENITREFSSAPTPLEYKIENRVTNFRVGQGRDIEVCGDVEKGYMDIELQGKTWQNLINKRHSTTPICDYGISPSTAIAEKTPPSDAGCGIRLNKITENLSYFICVINQRNIAKTLKPNTTYTLMLPYKSNKTLSRTSVKVVDSNATNYMTDSGDIQFNLGEGIALAKVTTIPSFSDIVVNNQCIYVYFPATKPEIISELEFEYFNPMFIEGDHTQTPIEELPCFFSGIKSSFENCVVDIESTGKNLLNVKLEDYKHSTGIYIKTNYIEGLKSEIDYRISARDFELTSSPDGGVRVYDENKNYIRRVSFGAPLRLAKDEKFISLYAQVYSAENVAKLEGTSVQIERGTFVTAFEPYHCEKVSFKIEEPLRSLPNGVSDEISEGKLIRRVGKAILNGSEGWNRSVSEKDNCIWFFSIGSIQSQGSKTTVNCLSNNFTSYSDSYMTDRFLNLSPAETFEGVNIVDNAIAMVIAKNKLATQDISGFRQWLQTNPTTVYYELKTPIITPIDPITFETQPLGYIEINSEIPPTSFHTVQLNRAAQIERGITEIAELKNRVEILETMYDSHFLETAHKLELLGMDYELESEEF